MGINFLLTNRIFPYNTANTGAVAQLGERSAGSAEVRGSIPLSSTMSLVQLLMGQAL